MEVEVHGKGGHTMAPPHDGSSVTARLARIVQKVETQFPPPRLLPPTSQLLKALAGVAENRVLGALLQVADRW